MKSLFGEVNNLAGFVHPKFNKEFKFMNERQSVNLARKILEEPRSRFKHGRSDRRALQKHGQGILF